MGRFGQVRGLLLVSLSPIRWMLEGKWLMGPDAIGIDLTYALMKKIYGTEVLNEAVNQMEYAPHLNADWDPYAVIHNLVCIGYVRLGITWSLI